MTQSAAPRPTFSAARWLRLDEAAAILGVPIVTLRRAIERNARRGADGSVLSKTDGVHARKFGRRWRVVLDAHWLAPLESGRQ